MSNKFNMLKFWRQRLPIFSKKIFTERHWIGHLREEGYNKFI